MSRFSWYWHRLRAMSPVEMALHVRKKFRQRADSRRLPDWSGLNLEPIDSFPRLPRPENAPPVLREALQRDVEDILAGRWKAFGHLDLKVDDPPKWQCDYLVGKDFATTESAFKLNHRALPGGADVRLIWELSRWYQLVRLAMAAYVLGDARAADKCVKWLEDWVKHNPPYQGWNWTSALEVGLRLIQFTWIDALLTSAGARTALSAQSGSDMDARTRLSALRRAILPPHVWCAWRHRSFGSSANNHLLGELAGCIVATVRWPELARCGASIEELQRRWEHEVLAQFAEDGGNKEQALNYQLFSWELCWQTWAALAESRRTIPPEIEKRLNLAAQFYVDVQAPTDPWDYGDSDNAYVTPFFSDEMQVKAEWHEWFVAPEDRHALSFWWPPSQRSPVLQKIGVPAKSAPSVSQQEAEDPRLLQQAECGPDLRTMIDEAIRDRRLTPEGELKPDKGEHDPTPPGWIYFPDSGQAIRRDGDWRLRWDLSPLGFLRTAAHGHLDALHLSLWFKGVAMVIDPGTGAYYADPQLRAWLASRSAHNVPTPEMPEWPSRLGPFLWARNHWDALLTQTPRGHGAWATFVLKNSGDSIEREIYALPSEDNGWLIIDRFYPLSLGPDIFAVRWQFAPGAVVERIAERHFRVSRRGVTVEAKVSSDWSEVWCVTEKSQTEQADPGNALAGIVSPSFRKTIWAPYLKLIARPTGGPCVFSTTFLAWPRA